MAAEELIKPFHLLMDKYRSRAQYAYMRSIINSVEEAHNFVNLFAEKTNTIWILHTGKQVSSRYEFSLTWFCNRSWRNKDTSQEDDCSAKIDIYVKKPEPSSFKYDEYLHYDPPLHSVIEICGHHNHILEHLDCKIIIGIKDHVKRDFFKYFQMGHTVSEAKAKYAQRFKYRKTTRVKYTPTLRQAQLLYNVWKGVKGWSAVKENRKRSQPPELTFKDILDAVPKREILYSVKNIFSKPDAPISIKDINFPLEFSSVGSIAAMPCSTAPLLYKLKHDIVGELFDDNDRPQIYSICIDSAASAVVVKDPIADMSQKSQNSTEQETDSILGIPLLANETNLSGDSAPKDVLSIPIKMEPLNDGYDDEPCQNSANKIENSLMPIITQAFSCGDGSTTQEADIKPNISYGNTTSKEIIKPNISCDKAGNSFFPLVFTLKGTVFETPNVKSLIYDLKQGSTKVQATEIVIPQIFSVRINSLNEAAFQFQDSSTLKAEGPLHIEVQNDFFKDPNATSDRVTTQRIYGKDLIPIIMNASPCCDPSPVVSKSTIGCSKKPRENLIVTPIVAPTNVVSEEVVQRKKLCKSVKPVTVTGVDTNDEDYLFLMSLLPELKRVPLDQKNNVKSKIKNILDIQNKDVQNKNIQTSQLTKKRIQFEKKSTNIYRDCGVLPISGGWKF